MKAGISVGGRLTCKGLQQLFDKYGKVADVLEIAIHDTGSIIDGRLNYKRWKDIKSALTGMPYEYTIHPPNALNFMSSRFFKKHVEVFETILYIACEINAKIMVYHSGIADESINNEIQYKKLLEREIETLKSLAKKAAVYGITICIEPTDGRINMGRGYGRNGAGIIPVVDAVNQPNVGICYDVGHVFIGSQTLGFDFVEDFKKCLPYIKHLHLHDNCGVINQPHPYNYYNSTSESYAFGFSDMHCPIGYGKIPFKEILPRLKGFEGIGILELGGYWEEDFEQIFADYNMIIENINKGNFKAIEGHLDEIAPKQCFIDDK